MPSPAERSALSGRTLPEVRQRRSSILEPRSTVVDGPRYEDRPPPGTVLDGRYVVGELLGQGGMGYVLAATHTVLGKRLAIKVLRREMTREPSMADLFREEARAASSIGHPNIVEVSDFGTLPATDGVAGASYFVMERIEGRCLADIVAEDGALEVTRAVDIVRQMASALHAAHERGLVHRDVKPENVMLTTRGDRLDHVKILDFGLASLGHDDLRVIGTPEYMSPEQGRARGVDRRSDVYSLGVVLFELVTGKVPFEDRDPLALLRKHAIERAPSAKSLREDLPMAVNDAIERSMSKKPGGRPQTMEAFIELLASIDAPTPTTPIRRSEPLVAIGLVASGPDSVDPSKPRASFSVPRASSRPQAAVVPASSPRPWATPRWAATRWAVPIVVAVIAMCAVVIGALILGRHPSTPSANAAEPVQPVGIAAMVTPTPSSETPAVEASPSRPTSAAPTAITSVRRATASESAMSPEATSTASPTTTPETSSMARGLYYADQNLLDPWE